MAVKRGKYGRRNYEKQKIQNRASRLAGRAGDGVPPILGVQKVDGQASQFPFQGQPRAVAGTSVGSIASSVINALVLCATHLCLNNISTSCLRVPCSPVKVKLRYVNHLDQCKREERSKIGSAFQVLEPVGDPQPSVGFPPSATTSRRMKSKVVVRLALHCHQSSTQCLVLSITTWMRTDITERPLAKVVCAQSS